MAAPTSTPAAKPPRWAALSMPVDRLPMTKVKAEKMARLVPNAGRIAAMRESRNWAMVSTIPINPRMAPDAPAAQKIAADHLPIADGWRQEQPDNHQAVHIVDQVHQPAMHELGGEQAQ